MPPTKACAKSPVWVSGWVPGNTAGDKSAACVAVASSSGNKQDCRQHRRSKERDVISGEVLKTAPENRRTLGRI
jgi:hypothetical protein